VNGIALSPAISGFIMDSNAHDIEAITARFTSDAVVEDEGATYRGIDEVARWVEKTHSEYRFTLEPLDSEQDGGEIIVTCSVSGTFAGSPIQLRFFFNMAGNKIAALKSGD
jgi:ketosteroid isomerase-like protein